MNYLKGKDQKEYSKHNARQFDRKNATAGQRDYSAAWIAGFKDVWDNGGFGMSYRFMKSNIEKKAFVRGDTFARKVKAKKS